MKYALKWRDYLRKVRGVKALVEYLQSVNWTINNS